MSESQEEFQFSVRIKQLFHLPTARLATVLLHNTDIGHYHAAVDLMEHIEKIHHRVAEKENAEVIIRRY